MSFLHSTSTVFSPWQTLRIRLVSQSPMGVGSRGHFEGGGYFAHKHESRARTRYLSDTTRLFSDILITACLAPSSSSRGLFLEFELCRIVLILLSLRITIHELDPRGTSLWFLSSCLCLLKKRWQLSRRQTRITNTIMVRPPNSRRFFNLSVC